ncbi:hypothetical protein C8J56DRAFT_891327 [Mycena floridula]|nr:hypothetical protein C8J56DRAFT_891327 [Mycena floridula]
MSFSMTSTLLLRLTSLWISTAAFIAVTVRCIRTVKARAGGGLVCKSAVQFGESDDGLRESLQEVESVEALISVKGSLIWDVIIMRDTVSPRYYAQDSSSALGCDRMVAPRIRYRF